MTWAQIHALYSIHDQPTSNLQPSFNIAPTQTVDFVVLNKGGNQEMISGRWGLVQFFAKQIGKMTTITAQIETVDTSGMFREPFENRRCLIPADGYFEWTTSEADGRRDPWMLHLPEDHGFSFAGLWAHKYNLGITG